MKPLLTTASLGVAQTTNTNATTNTNTNTNKDSSTYKYSSAHKMKTQKQRTALKLKVGGLDGFKLGPLVVP